VSSAGGVSPSGSGIGSVLRAAQLSDETLLEAEKNLVPDSTNPITTAMLSSLSKLEKGNFGAALEDMEETIGLIGTSHNTHTHTPHRH
jgi:hypothetical protein